MTFPDNTAIACWRWMKTNLNRHPARMTGRSPQASAAKAVFEKID
ncbi:hypothetical protein [Polaromonas sp. CG9_12]|nr:hypothetical protein [Polaromonas sp. CG9_12]